MNLRENSALRSEVIEGLGRTPKALPPKLLYDARGSELFERICETDEYKIARLELEILKEHAGEIAQHVDRGAVLLEFGSGSSVKTNILLENLRSLHAYVPIDISDKMLLQSSHRIAREHTGLTVIPLCADFTQPLPPLSRPPLSVIEPRTPRVGFMPGSTLGNFEREAARNFLHSLGSTLGTGFSLLLGIDLVKDPALMLAAYNDQKGVTAAFNLNLLERLNRELDADFDLNHFTHRARFNFWESRMEMHLESTTQQTVRVGGHLFPFERGETIHTENSYKYTPENFGRLARAAGYEVRACWCDAQNHFAVFLLRFEKDIQAANSVDSRLLGKKPSPETRSAG